MEERAAGKPLMLELFAKEDTELVSPVVLGCCEVELDGSVAKEFNAVCASEESPVPEELSALCIVDDGGIAKETLAVP